MGCKICIFALIHWLFCVNYILCHLKDLGEVTMNSTNHVLKDIEAKIIGGRPVLLKQYPFNVQFYNFGGLCSGSILTKKTVLTAAHCFCFNKNLAEMMVIAHPRFAFDMRASTHGVWDFKIHEDYNRKHLFSSDIAIIIVHTDFVFGPYVQKASIVTTNIWMKVNQVFTATGWGETKYGYIGNNNPLHAVELRYVPLKKCMDLNGVKLGADMFCLYAKGKDTCKGDSGGGILWKGILVGITSHGRGCGGTPGMYTNVYHFRSWITKTVATLSNNYCSFHHS